MEPLEKHLADARNVIGITQLQVEFALEAIDNKDVRSARHNLKSIIDRIKNFTATYPRAR